MRAVRLRDGERMALNELAPLKLLPHFRYLSDQAQYSIMTQLVDKFKSQPDRAAAMAAAVAVVVVMDSTGSPVRV
jgi:hypothetical protein